MNYKNFRGILYMENRKYTRRNTAESGPASPGVLFMPKQGVEPVKNGRLSEKKWFNGAVITCIGVAFYVLLTHLQPVMSVVGKFLGSFRSVFFAVIFAYIINPFAKIFYYRVFKKMKVGKRRWALSVIVAFLTGLIFLGLLIGMLIPQLVQSIKQFAENYESYAEKLIALINNSPLGSFIKTERLKALSQNALTSAQNYVRENSARILSSAASSGKRFLSFLISLILAVCFLMNKVNILKGTRRLTRTIMMRRETSEELLNVLLRCDTILVSYIGQSLLDALIVGALNAIFMAVCGMKYIGLVSVIVAVTNLVPTFGPVIGAVIGAFFLVMVNPWHALMFLGFTVLLQLVDAYILKPKLFSHSLGVPGLLILVSVIVFGNLFGAIGMLLAIPAAAILSFLYHEYLLPRQERRKQQQRDTQDEAEV